MEKDGQYTIFECLENFENTIKEKYKIPKLDKKYIIEEGWWDNWHYTQLETPENDVYFTITDFGDFWTYNYRAYQDGKWFYWSSWYKRWMPEDKIPFAWVGIPSLYMKRDETLKEIFNL